MENVFAQHAPPFSTLFKRPVKNRSPATTMVQQFFFCTKNRLFKTARSSRLPEQWAIYRTARNKATNAIKMAKANHFNRMASSLANPKCPPSKWWNIARDMCGLKGHSSNIVPPLKGKDNNTVFDDIDKANILNDTFINQKHQLPSRISLLAQHRRKQYLR